MEDNSRHFRRRHRSRRRIRPSSSRLLRFRYHRILGNRNSPRRRCTDHRNRRRHCPRVANNSMSYGRRRTLKRSSWCEYPIVSTVNNNLIG